MISKGFSNRQRKERNSTIKEEEQLNNQNDLQYDSSIQINEDVDAHYYNLDYSDQDNNQEIVSSSEEGQREITHQEFLQMITTNKYKKHPQFKEDYSESEDENYNQFHKKPQNRSTKSHDFKQIYNKSQIHKCTPSTREKSQNLYEYVGVKNAQKNQRNDPQKSSSVKNKLGVSKQKSFNVENSVRQFRIDSFLNGQVQKKKQKKSKAWQQYNKGKFKDQDQSFSLITLPQYDEETFSSKAEKQNNQEKYRRQQRYKKVAKLNCEQERDYDKLNWRYQQAKLKFMDSFLPESLKIGSSSYNMLKYMSKKSDLTYNMVML